MTHYTENLKKEILKRSTEKVDFDKAILEWEAVDYTHDIMGSNCICSHDINHIFIFKHKVTKDKIQIGSECITKLKYNEFNVKCRVLWDIRYNILRCYYCNKKLSKKYYRCEPFHTTCSNRGIISDNAKLYNEMMNSSFHRDKIQKQEKQKMIKKQRVLKLQKYYQTKYGVNFSYDLMAIEYNRLIKFKGKNKSNYVVNRWHSINMKKSEFYDYAKFMGFKPGWAYYKMKDYKLRRKQYLNSPRRFKK